MSTAALFYLVHQGRQLAGRPGRQGRDDGFEPQAPHRDIGITFDGPHLVLRDLAGYRSVGSLQRDAVVSSPWPVGVTAVGNRQDSDGVLPVINGVQGAVVAAPGCPDIVKGCFQRFAQPVRITGHWTGQVLVQRGRSRQREPG